MKGVLPCLTWLFNVLASACKWGFILLSALVLYRNGFTYTITNWLLLLTIIFALLVTICDFFAMIRIRLPYVYLTHAKQRTRNTDNE
jgi:hypothetical protein